MRLERATGAVTRIDIVAPQELSSADLAAWRDLQSAYPELASPFLSAQWVLTMASIDGPDRRGARIAVLRRGDEAVGFLPVRVTRSTAMPVGSPFCDYQGLVAAPDLAVDARRIVAALGVSRLDLHNALGAQTAFARHHRVREDSWVIDVAAGYPAFAAERRAAGTDILQDCAKKRRKLQREHGEVVFAARSVDRGAFEQLFDWKRAQLVATHQTDLFQTPWAQELMEATFAADGADFGGALFTLHAGGRLVAAQYALHGRDVLHSWMISHHPDFGRYSPGLVLLDEMLRWAPEAGYREIDLGPGAYRFKESFSNVRRSIAEGYVGLPSAATLFRAAEYLVCRMAEALPLGPMSTMPTRAMRRLDRMRGLVG
ncbi:GNAT family N-acetyltransferase [Phenylobacterium sp.]|uniref:GNAT family N-acetyltransferase n=1 Tax=Phenylobacterium sp. TaxID=1871053 RepID=UPI002732AB42|nr:GNAT family N-acetyltransferase [Phenylobacterium sp.]MDP3659400.1 GNAT family N-acetyltransferase [Phenylobacterium sp.]